MKTIPQFLTAVAAILFITACNQEAANSTEPEADNSNTKNVESMESTNLKAGKNSVTFISDGSKVAALLFLPQDFDPTKKYKTVITTPPATGVKEQVVGLYAEELSKKGYVALSYDPRGWGESEGNPFLLNPWKMADDTKNGVSYLLTLPFVDKDNVHNLGICMGSGFAGFATATDARIKSLAVVSPYVDAAESYRKALGGSSAAVRQYMLSQGGKARQLNYETGEVVTIPVVPANEQQADETKAPPVARGMMEYYNPDSPGGGYCDNWNNKLNAISIEGMASFQVFDYCDLYEGIPALVIYGDQAITKEGAQKMYDLLNGPKELMVVEGAGHFDLYWKPEFVSQAVNRIDEFLSK